MRHQMIAWVLAIGTTFFVYGKTHAEEAQYWVSIASFDQLQQAENAARSASDALSDDFQVLGSATSNGYFYRVVNGPYLTKALAEDRVRNAQEVGFDGAWLWVDRSGTTSTRLGEVLSEVTVDEDINAQDANLIRDKQPLPKLVEEAPEGYQLNKLERE